jgi:hypothetical protein
MGWSDDFGVRRARLYMHALIFSAPECGSAGSGAKPPKLAELTPLTDRVVKAVSHAVRGAP